MLPKGTCWQDWPHVYVWHYHFTVSKIVAKSLSFLDCLVVKYFFFCNEILVQVELLFCDNMPSTILWSMEYFSNFPPFFLSELTSSTNVFIYHSNVRPGIPINLIFHLAECWWWIQHKWLIEAACKTCQKDTCWVCIFLSPFISLLYLYTSVN